MSSNATAPHPPRPSFIEKSAGTLVALAIVAGGLCACVVVFLYLWVMPMRHFRVLGWKEAAARVNVRAQMPGKGCIPYVQAQVFRASDGLPRRYVSTISIGQCPSRTRPEMRMFDEDGVLLANVETFPAPPHKWRPEDDLSFWVRGLEPGEFFPE